MFTLLHSFGVMISKTVTREILPAKHFLLSQPYRGTGAAAAVEIGIGQLALLLFDADDHRRLLRAVAVRVDGLIAEIILAAFAVGGSIDEMAVRVQIEPALDGLGRDGIGQRVAVRRPGETVRRTDKKVGPNDKCPCGSGLKYKNCCGLRGGGSNG